MKSSGPEYSKLPYLYGEYGPNTRFALQTNDKILHPGQIRHNFFLPTKKSKVKNSNISIIFLKEVFIYFLVILGLKPKWYDIKGNDVEKGGGGSLVWMHRHRYKFTSPHFCRHCKIFCQYSSSHPLPNLNILDWNESNRYLISHFYILNTSGWCLKQTYFCIPLKNPDVTMVWYSGGPFSEAFLFINNKEIRWLFLINRRIMFLLNFLNK